jgi:anti-sigma factor RsiW
MVHPTDSELIALVHHESSAGRPGVLRAHLASCEPCQLRCRTLAQQDGKVASLLTLLDAPVPTVPLTTITRRARHGRRSRPVAAAAAAILVAATAAATVIPGAPFHPFFRSVVGKPTLPTRPALRPAPAPADTAGVTVLADTDVTIAFRYLQTAGEIRLSWASDAAVVTVRAAGGQVGYTVRPGRVTVENQPPAARYEITIPRTIPAATLTVGHKVLWQSIVAAHPDRSRGPITFDLSKLKETQP